MSGFSCCFIRVIGVIRGYSPFEVEEHEITEPDAGARSRWRIRYDDH